MVFFFPLFYCPYMGCLAFFVLFFERVALLDRRSAVQLFYGLRFPFFLFLFLFFSSSLAGWGGLVRGGYGVF